MTDAGNRTHVDDVYADDDTRDRKVDYGYDDLYRLTRETVTEKNSANEFVVSRRIEYTYDRVGNRETMTVTHDDMNTSGACVTESVTAYEYDANDRLTMATTEVNPLSPVAQARFNDYYARRPAGWTRWAVLGFASVTLTAFFAPLLMPYGRRLGRRARRQRIRSACIAAFLIPLMAVDPQTVDALTTEALRAQACIAAGIPLDVEPSTTTVNYTYDANGNQTSRTTVQDNVTTVETFIFDVENRLASYRKSIDGSAVHSASVSYSYDADGVRASKTHLSKTTLYTTDKNRPYAQVLEEREAKEGDLLVRYTYGDDLISQTRPDGSSGFDTRYYHYDGQMSTRQLTDDNATPASVATTDHYTYDAFGNDLKTDGPTNNAYRYTGEQFDAEVGQYYLRARYYDQGMGRFSSRDSFGGIISDPISMHRYAYCAASPVNKIDPSGLCSAAAFGSYAHVVISELYESEHLGNNYIIDRPIAWPDIKIRPDIADHTLNSIIEIKPLSVYGITTGYPQLAGYLAAKTLTTGEPWRPGTWQPGIRIFPGGNCAKHLLLTLFNAAGVLFYMRVKNPYDTVGEAMRNKERIVRKVEDALRNAKPALELAPSIGILTYVATALERAVAALNLGFLAFSRSRALVKSLQASAMVLVGAVALSGMLQARYGI
ncbi:MAG: hypothetical protein DHS20C16_24290 [Phycisphaerae bacterium]|nr:MAG: hypothetical protein DHS20C16_24290 [Phycisphaerae bacterium]